MSLEEQVTALQRQVEELQAREAIRHLIAQYARCIDEDRMDELQELFTEDATVQNLPWNQRPAVGKAMAMKAFRNYRQTFEHPRRYITNIQVRAHGDTAEADACWSVTQAYQGQAWYGSGTYEWGFRKEDEQWKISRFVIKIEIMTTLAEGWGAPDGPVSSLPRRP